MAAFKSFEEIEAWVNARSLANTIYLKPKEGSFSKDFELRNQINRASGSIMDNIAEGFERGGNREFVHFLSIAKGSAGEVRSQLYRALDRNYLTIEEFENYKLETTVIAKQISGLITYLKNSEMKGSKFLREPKVDYTLEPETLNLKH